MKRLSLLLGLMLFFSAISWGQSAPDSTRRQARQRVHRLIDENADGVSDRSTGGQRTMMRGMDRFIDTDGDGICDGREAGFGLRRGKTTATPQGQKGRRGK